MRVGSHVNEGRLDPNMCMVHVCVHKQAPLQVHMCAYARMCVCLSVYVCLYSYLGVIKCVYTCTPCGLLG